MVKKKSHLSLFSTLVPQITTESSSSAECHLIDNEYFVAFDSLNDIQQFHSKLIEKQSTSTHDDVHLHSDQVELGMDMKSFAQQFLIDSPEPPTMKNSNASETSSQDLFSTDQPINWSPKVKMNTKRKETSTNNFNIETGSKRQRRHIRDLPQSRTSPLSSRSKRIAYEDMSSILLTLDGKQKTKRSLMRNENEQPTIVMELAEPSIIKTEPTESQQLIISHVVQTKEEPVEINVVPTGPMNFGTADYSGYLDNYVQNIHRSCATNVSLPEPISSRPKRIRKRKKFYIEESESTMKIKKLRKKPIPPAPPPPAALLTDAEIEQQFGERLSPTIKTEHDETQPMATSRVVIEIEPVPQTPIERARAKLINALGRGHGPDTFLLKIRSRENKMIEVQLAIYGTADWHLYRTKILAKIEEALRGLRVSWTKIDIRVDEFDVQICTSPQTAALTPLSSVTNCNSSWFLKVLSESGPLIVHIHDRRRPQQRHQIKCPCPHCSPNEPSAESSLPVIVSVSPDKSTVRQLSPPTILRKTHQTFPSSISSLQNIDTTFFKHLIHQYGTNTITSVTQCVLDIALIVSVHTSFAYLQTSTNDSYEEYRMKYQEIIDPLRYTNNENENPALSKTNSIVSTTIKPDVFSFYSSIKTNKANIRNAQAMRNLITSLVPKSNIAATPSTIIKATTLILPKSISSLPSAATRASRPLLMNRSVKRNLTQTDNGLKQQAHFTPIIELKPILSGSTSIDETTTTTKKITTIISTNNLRKDLQRLNTITTQEISPPLTNGTRVIRLSIAKPLGNTSQQPSVSSPPTIRLISPRSTHSTVSVNKGESVPLVPKQINIIKPFSSSIVPANKLINPILIANRILEQRPMK